MELLDFHTDMRDLAMDEKMIGSRLEEAWDEMMMNGPEQLHYFLRWEIGRAHV